MNSEFDGGLLQLIGRIILGSLVSTITLGIAFPWAICSLYEWEAKHTVIDGKRLAFDGKAVQLFGMWIKWLFFIIITIGIYQNTSRKLLLQGNTVYVVSGG